MQKQNTFSPATIVMKGAKTIMETEYEPIKFIINDLLIAVGLTIFAGAPKAGKSLLILQMLLAITSGKEEFLGHKIREKVRALYLALEDPESRLQDRMEKQGVNPIDDSLMFATRWPFDNEGIKALDKFLESNPDFKAVVIDTKGRFMGDSQSTDYSYQKDYSWMARVKEIADNRQVSIVLVTHFRKKTAEFDDYEAISGSSAIMGAADTAIMLKRTRNQSKGTLCLTGRDFPEREEEIFFDTATLTWHAPNDTSRKVVENLTPERQKLLDILQSLGGIAAPKDIAARYGGESKNVSNMLSKMAEYGFVERSSTKHGYWKLPGYPEEQELFDIKPDDEPEPQPQEENYDIY